MEWISHLIWLCPLLFGAGFLDAIAGGGGLIALPAYLMTGMPAHDAYGCNKLQSGIGSTAAAIRYWKCKTLDLKPALVSAAAAIIGSVISTHIVFLLSDQELRRLLLIILPTAAVLLLLGRFDGKASNQTCPMNVRNVLLALLLGLLMGLYDGIFGPGGGTICIMLFSLLLHYDLKVAAGNSKIVILVSNYIALISYILSGSILYQIAIPAAICNLVGSYLGAGFAVKKGARVIRPVMIIVVFCLLIKCFI